MDPYVTITVRGARGTVALDAVVDTGFDGDVCLPVDVAVMLGLPLIAHRQAEYADGRVERELVFEGEANFMNEWRTVEVVLTEGDEALIGTQLLSDCILHVNFQTGEVKIECIES